MLRPEDIIEFRKEGDEYKRNYAKTHPEKYESGYGLEQWVKTQQAQGRIVDPFIQNWLDGEIAAARNVLIIGMLLTVLIKGQIVIWVIMYLAYRARVKHARAKAFEADRNRRKNERLD